LFRSSDVDTHQLGDSGIYEVLARIPANFLAEATYSITVSCIVTWKNEPREYPLVVYNALTFIAFSTQSRPASGSGRVEKPGLIAPILDWAVKQEEANAARA
jgi:hypothetical protein